MFVPEGLTDMLGRLWEGEMSGSAPSFPKEVKLISLKYLQLEQSPDGLPVRLHVSIGLQLSRQSKAEAHSVQALASFQSPIFFNSYLPSLAACSYKRVKHRYISVLADLSSFSTAPKYPKPPDRVGSYTATTNH